MKRRPRQPLLLMLALLLTLGVPAHAEVRECPPLPDGEQALSDEALSRHCQFAESACSPSPTDPGGVKQCSGLVCAQAPGETEYSCRLPQSSQQCPGGVDIARSGGYCDLTQAFAGKRCELVEHAPLATESMAGPDDPPPAEPPAPTYQPTQATIDAVCGGLGCVDDPSQSDPHLGICGLAQTATDCGGRAEPELYGGWCGPTHLEVVRPRPTTPRRWLVTGSYLVDAGNGTLGSDVAPGAVFQLGLSVSKVRRLPGGGVLHFGLPSMYLHAAAFASQRRLGHELGLVYKTGAEIVTRLGIGAYGQLWSEDDVVSTDPLYGLGPSAHVELFYNILVRGAWLVRDDEGPQATFGIQYAATLFDDFK